MKFRFLRRFDQRHSSAQPKSCCARRLAFEHCEDRLVLSGSSLATPIVSAPDAGEGGFLAFDSSHVLQIRTNDFLFDADDSFALPSALLSGYQWHSIRSSSGESQFVGNSSGNEFASLVLTLDVGPAFFELDSADPQVLESFVPTEELHIVRDDVDTNVGDSEDIQPDPLPGLGGKTLRLLIIDDPIQITANTASSELREGGALEVTVAVFTTQRAYETQLAAIVVHNLNHDELLPVAAPHRIQPIVAELARAVAFETLGQQATTSTGKVERATEGLLRSSNRGEARPALVPVSAQLGGAKWHHNASEASEIEESTKLATKQSTHSASALANLAERVDDERQAMHATTYAQWPALAAVVAGYLMVDRRVAPAAPSMQAPPRRARQMSGK